jgi:hypothetical protein
MRCIWLAGGRDAPRHAPEREHRAYADAGPAWQ